MKPNALSTLRPYAWTLLFAVASSSLLPVHLTAAGEEEATLASEQRDPPIWHGEQVVGVFESAYLGPNETAEQVVAVFGDAIAEGRVREQVVAVFGNVAVTQDVGEMVVCVFGDVKIGPDVHVGEMVVVIGGTLDLDPTARVGEQVVNIPLPGFSAFNHWLRENALQGRLYQYDRRSTWVFIGVLLLLNLALGALFRRPVEYGVRALDRKPAMTLINGLLAAVIVPPLVFLLLVTGIGVLVLPFLFAAIVFTTWIGMLGLFCYCGVQFGFHRQPLLALAAGHVIFAALFAVPYLGLVVWSMTTLIGIGTAFTALSEARRQETKRNGGSPPNSAAPPPVPAAPLSSQPAGKAAASAPAPEAVAAAPEPAAHPAEAEPGSPPPPPPNAESRRPSSAAAPPPPPLPGTLERAGFGPRLAATLLDLLLVVVAARFLDSLDLFLYIWLAYHVAFWTWRQTTLGGTILNLRIERLDGRPVDFGVALIRAMSSALSLLPLGVGFLWVIWDSESQSWHDKIAGTSIVRAPRGHSLI